MKYAIYSDGSYKNGIWGAGAVILQETPFGFNPVQELSFFGEDADGIRNVAGEIYGVLEALRLLFKINQSSRDVDSVTVYHDYEGLRYKRCGYPLQRRTDKPCDRRKFGAGNGDARDCNFRKQSGIIPERTGAKWQV